MYQGFVLKAYEQSDIAKANQARHNFGYDDDDTIVITKFGAPVQIETLIGASNFLNEEQTDIYVALEKMLAKLNGETPSEAEYREYYETVSSELEGAE